MKRSTVMGFTEAEIGFVIAALFAAIAVALVHDREADRTKWPQVIEDLNGKLKIQQQRVADLEAELAELRKKVSTKVPQCWEKGQQREPIAVVTVVSEDRYEVGGRRMLIDDLTEELADKIALGNSLGCRFVVKARPMPGVDAIAQSTAVWRLRQFFDVDDRPR